MDGRVDASYFPTSPSASRERVLLDDIVPLEVSVRHAICTKGTNQEENYRFGQISSWIRKVSLPRGVPYTCPVEEGVPRKSSAMGFQLVYIHPCFGLF